MFLASQIVGVFAFSLYLVSYWQKDRRTLLTLSVIECILFAIQYFLLGSMTGAIINLVGILRSSTFMYKDKNNFMKSYTMPSVIHLLYFLNAIFTWEGYITLIPTIASFMKCHTMWQNNTKTIRRNGIPIQILWLIYGIYLNSYVSIFFQIVLIISIAVAIVRLDVLRGRKIKYNVKINVYLNALEKMFKNNNQNFVYDKNAIKDPEYMKFVCLRGNKPVGYIALYPQSDFLETHGFPKPNNIGEFSVFIWHIIVRKGYERKGVATTLLNEIRKVYTGYEVYSVLDSRNNPSILFHNTQGFTKVFDFQAVYENKIEKFDLMQLKISLKNNVTQPEISNLEQKINEFPI